MEKQVLVLVKAIKDFRVYIFYSHIVAYIPNSVVKDILTQDGLDGKRGKWIATILEYDIEIKPTKLIKAQGLAKLRIELNFQSLDINSIAPIDNEEEMAAPLISQAFIESPRYSDIVYILLNLQAPLELCRAKSRFLKMKSLKFCILDNALFWRNHEGIIFNFLLKEESDKVLEEFHASDYGGHLYWKTTIDKILRASFYWPTLFSDVKKYVTSCHKWRIFEGKKKLLPLPLKPISTEINFQQWGLDFIGEIHPPSSAQHKSILTATDYFVKWIEAIPSRQASNTLIITFLETNILSRFECPTKLITDNAIAFKSKTMIDFYNKYHITLGHSIAYYPQGNGLTESSNKNLVNIIKKLL